MDETTERDTLNKRIARLLAGVPIRFIDYGKGTIIERIGIDEDDIAYDVLADYEHDLNATMAVLPEDYGIVIEPTSGTTPDDQSQFAYEAWIRRHGHGRPTWLGEGDTRQQAAAHALEAWALATAREAENAKT